MKLTKILLILIFATTITQSNAMEQKQVASDFQIYQLLSTTQDNPDFYLPQELIQVITLRAHEITRFANFLLIDVHTLTNFIEKQAVDSKDIELTIHILKLCLKYHGKSLCDIKSGLSFSNSLHLTIEKCFDAEDNFKHKSFQRYCIDVLCRVAGEQLMNLLLAQDDFGHAALTHSVDQIYQLLDVQKMINERTLKRDLLNCVYIPHYVKVILKYLNEDQVAQLFLLDPILQGC